MRTQGKRSATIAVIWFILNLSTAGASTDHKIVAVRLQNAVALPGQIVELAVLLETADYEVEATQVEIETDSAFKILAAGRGASCKVVQDLPTVTQVFAFEPSGCLPDSTCSFVRAFITAGSLQQDGDLFRCDSMINLPPDAAPGRISVVCSLATTADPSAVALPTTCTDGSVTVTTVVGDCNGDGRATIDEIIRSVRIALSDEPLRACPPSDADLSGVVEVSDLVRMISDTLLAPQMGARD